MKITDKTTVPEADVERLRLGITSMYVSITPVDGRQRVEVLAVTPEGVLSATAHNWLDALADVYEKRTKQLAAYFAPREVKANDRILASFIEPYGSGWQEPVETLHVKPSREPFRPMTAERHPATLAPDYNGDEMAARARAITRTPRTPYTCNVPMCGDSGVCEECRKRGAR